MAKYRKKPVVINAIKHDSNNCTATKEWVKKVAGVDDQESLKFVLYDLTGKAIIKTLAGTMIGFHGDYIIRGVDGEFYPIKSSIFEKTYEKVRFPQE